MMRTTDTYPLAVVFSSLAKAAAKQQRTHDAELWGQLAETFDRGAGAEGDLAALTGALAEDVATAYPDLNAAADAVNDRGMKRALKWGERVTKIQKTLLERYAAKGEELFEGKQLFLCEACGFVFLGAAAPDPCPVCKAPVSRFSVIK